MTATPTSARARVEQLDSLLEAVATASEASRRERQDRVFTAADDLLASGQGLAALDALAPRYDDVGLFSGRPWADPSALQVPLVAGTLRGSGLTPVAETPPRRLLLVVPADPVSITAFLAASSSPRTEVDPGPGAI